MLFKDLERFKENKSYQFSLLFNAYTSTKSLGGIPQENVQFGWLNQIEPNKPLKKEEIFSQQVEFLLSSFRIKFNEI